MSLTIADLVREAHETALSKGWHPNEELQHPRDEAARAADANRFGALMALIHSEVSEAVEAYRERGTVCGWTRDDGKGEGVPAELADVLIRVADVAGLYGIDLEDAVRRKLDFNKTRPHRHGGKRL